MEDTELVEWVRLAAAAAEDKLGQRTEAFFVGEILGITDWFLVTSGRNQRQVRAIVDAVEEAVHRGGGPKPRRIEGKETLAWVLMDYGIFVVHVFTEEARETYDLERLWRDVPRLPLSA
jgi:ribosome-associated protein